MTLLMGILLGYLAQRSRFCLIGGLRDFIFVRDTELLKGAIAFFITAWLAFSIASVSGLIDLQAPQLHETIPGAATAVAASPLTLQSGTTDFALWLSQVNWLRWVLITVAGIALGLFSTIANGCPTRQHILAAQGNQVSVFYLAGFYLGVIVFYLVTKPFIAMFM